MELKLFIHVNKCGSFCILFVERLYDVERKQARGFFVPHCRLTLMSPIFCPFMWSFVERALQFRKESYDWCAEVVRRSRKKMKGIKEKHVMSLKCNLRLVMIEIYKVKSNAKSRCLFENRSYYSLRSDNHLPLP